MNSFLLLCDMFLFIFWKILKTPKRHFKINWPLMRGLRTCLIYFLPGFPTFPKTLLKLKSHRGPKFLISYLITLKLQLLLKIILKKFWWTKFWTCFWCMVPKLFRLLWNSCQVSWYPNIRPFKYYLSMYKPILFTAGKYTEINRHGQKKVLIPE